ncbi:hypothetical protein [Azospirillum argentinense]|uniref:DUF2163 domain-containing protein n=1 Tax=Azospirillum argentinense TaxID=2970906 RepID=UPI0032DEE87F
MKTITPAMAAALRGRALTFATCWHVTRRDGRIMGFTDHPQDLVFEGVRYSARSGFTRTSIRSAATLSVDNMDVDGLFTAGGITERDVRAKLYAAAPVEVFLVDYRTPARGRLMLRSGWLGEWTIKDDGFTLEVRGLAQRLQQSIGQVYQPTCRVDFCSAKCGLLAAAWTSQGAVAAASSRGRFEAAGLGQPDGFFNGGLLTWLTGANAGLQAEVGAWRGGAITFFMPVPFPILAGDTFKIMRWCDKRRETCRDTFGNVINFRGEPDVPGAAALRDTPDYGDLLG